MSANLDRATYRVITSLRRRAAGEHTVSVGVLVKAFAGEWRLSETDKSELVRRARREQERLRIAK